MKILITGFEPFQDVPRNPTGSIAEYFNELGAYKGAHIDGVVLPVVLNAWEKVEPLLENNYDVMLHFGADPVHPYMNVERMGLNLDDFRIPDNEGNQVEDQPIRRDGEMVLFTRLPVKKFVNVLKEKDYPVRLSYSAGTYLCNHIMYESLYYSKDKPDVWSGFIHVPLQQHITEERLIEAVKLILDITIEEKSG